MQISQGLSWEKTIIDLFAAFQPKDTNTEFPFPYSDDNLAYLRVFNYVIVLIERQGCFIVKKEKNNTSSYHAVIIPNEMEDNDVISKTGEMLGLTTSTMLHVLEVTNKENDSPLAVENMIKALKNGLCSMRKIYNFGFEIKNDQTGNELIFPFLEWKINQPSNDFLDLTNLQLEDPDVRNKFTIVEAVFNAKEKLEETCYSIVTNGWETAIDKKFPVAKFGKFITTDRFEIEQYHEIQKLIEDHFQKSSKTRPLSIAVFGEPGSGKSFAIKQMTESFTTIEKDDISFLKFNLSHFIQIQDLYEAFQFIRDTTLKGKKVLVFWDEIDVEFNKCIYGWIDFFLQVMQDGVYYQASIEHSLGSPVFIFASSHDISLEELLGKIKGIPAKDEKPNEVVTANANAEPVIIVTNDEPVKTVTNDEPVKIVTNDEPENNASKTDNHYSTKIEDWISRIHGHIDIKGINPNKDPELRVPADTISVSLRKAILLRSILEKQWPMLFSKDLDNEYDDFRKATCNIEEDLIDLLIFKISEFKYGIRSFESIIQMSHLHDKRRFSPSCLPSLDQFRAHVGDSDFKYLKNKLG